MFRSDKICNGKFLLYPTYRKIKCHRNLSLRREMLLIIVWTTGSKSSLKLKEKMSLWNGMPHDLKNGIILRDAIYVEWFKIFESQNPEFKILGCQNPQFNILNLQNLEFKLLDVQTVLNSRLLRPKGLNSKYWNARTPEFKILDFQNSQFKILDRQSSRSRFWIAKILNSRLY